MAGIFGSQLLGVNYYSATNGSGGQDNVPMKHC